MRTLTFSSFAQTYASIAAKKNMTSVVNSLLSIIFDNCEIKNKNGENYIMIDAHSSGQYFRGNEDIPVALRDGMVKNLTVEDIGKEIEALIYDNTDELQRDSANSALYDMVSKDTYISSNDKNTILSAYDNGEWAVFYGHIYWYVIMADNKSPVAKVTPKKKIKADAIEAALDALRSIPKPVAIAVPEELSKEELPYIKELLKVFAEQEGVTIISETELSTKAELSKYKDKLNEHRKYYYAAESIREGIRDIDFDSKAPFEELKDETYDAVYDVAELSYPTGAEKLHKVMAHLTTVSLTSILASIPGWIQTKEKKGICHMLVNDKRIKWVNGDE